MSFYKECQTFVDNMNSLNMDFTEYKKYLSKNDLWDQYSNISTRVLFTGGYKSFVRRGVSKEAYKVIRDLTGYRPYSGFKANDL